MPAWNGQLQLLDVSNNRPLKNHFGRNMNPSLSLPIPLLVKIKKVPASKLMCGNIFEDDLRDNNGARRMIFHGKIWIL